jgi:hypothetical protein
MLENTFLFKKYFIISKMKLFIWTIFMAPTLQFPEKYTRILRRFEKENVILLGSEFNRFYDF